MTLNVSHSPPLQQATIRAFAPHEWAAYREIRLRSLADSPDAFGSTWADEQGRSPESWAARLAAAATSGRDFPLLAQVAGAAAGLAWARADASDPSLVNLFQLWVAPDSRGRGVAAALLGAAIDWARSNNARVIQLGVTCGDTPATRLYARHGFRASGAPGPLRPGSALLSQTMRLDLA
jgi:GNAT superfamily N-acetyltransferase